MKPCMNPEWRFAVPKILEPRMKSVVTSVQSARDGPYVMPPTTVLTLSHDFYKILSLVLIEDTSTTGNMLWPAMKVILLEYVVYP